LKTSRITISIEVFSIGYIYGSLRYSQEIIRSFRKKIIKKIMITQQISPNVIKKSSLSKTLIFQRKLEFPIR